MAPVSEIKLIRTDTTLDLSQKAEKVWFPPGLTVRQDPRTFGTALWSKKASRDTKTKQTPRVQQKTTKLSLVSEGVTTFCNLCGDDGWLDSFKGQSKLRTAC